MTERNRNGKGVMNNDYINHPAHYISKSGLETIDVLRSFTEGLEGIEAVCTGNALKYLCRWKHKNGVEDLRKAVWYINYLIGKLEKRGEDVIPESTKKEIDDFINKRLNIPNNLIDAGVLNKVQDEALEECAKRNANYTISHPATLKLEDEYEKIVDECRKHLISDEDWSVTYHKLHDEKWSGEGRSNSGRTIYIEGFRFNSQRQASKYLDDLEKRLKQKGYITVRDAKECAGIVTYIPDDDKYGWKNKFHATLDEPRPDIGNYWRVTIHGRPTELNLEKGARLSDVELKDAYDKLREKWRNEPGKVSICVPWVTFKSKRETKKYVNGLKDLLQQKGYITLRDMKERAGMTPDHYDAEYGWKHSFRESIEEPRPDTGNRWRVTILGCPIELRITY